MQPIDNSRKRVGKIFIVIILLLTIGCLTECLREKISSQREEEAEALLTQDHGEEAREAVEHFEHNWMTLEMQNNEKKFFNDLLTGPRLRLYLDGHWPSSQDNLDYWSVNSGVDVINLRVVEYDGQSMKVIACIERRSDKVDLDGTFIEHLPTGEYTRFYVFMIDEGSWKVANVIDITNPDQAIHEWWYMSQEFKDITGDFESYYLKDCEIQD